MHWNAQGITNRSDIAQLEHFLHENQIDVLFINETFLNTHHKFKLSHFKVYRNDRSSHGGGVLIAVNSSIPHQVKPPQRTKNIENLSIIIFINSRSIRFTSAYSPKHTPHFLGDMNILTGLSEEFFIFGDFNARHSSWNCLRNNTAGNQLFSHQLQGNYYIHAPTDYTRYSQNDIATQPSVVDLVLTNSSLQLSEISTHPGTLSSDHVPITCEIYGSVPENQLKVPMYKLADWNSIRSFVNTRICTYEIDGITESNIENTLQHIESTFEKAAG